MRLRLPPRHRLLGSASHGHITARMPNSAMACRGKLAAPRGMRPTRPHVLARYRAKRTEEVVVHRADGATCNCCLLKAACTDGAHARTFHRSFCAESREQVRGYHATAADQQGMRQRKV